VLIGLVLAGMVLILFLRNVRVMLIASLVVLERCRERVVAECVRMSFNIMTLGGSPAAVGLVTTMPSSWLSTSRAAPAHRRCGRPRTVLPAAREFMRPLTGSSLAR